MKPKFIIISGEYPEYVNKIKHLFDCDIICTKPNIYLEKEISFHPDMQFLDFGEDVFIAGGSEYLAEYFIKVGKHIHLLNIPANSYPKDVICNGCFIDNTLIVNPKTIAPEIITFAHEKHFNIIDVKQGYTKCSVIPVNRNTIITSDIGINKKAINSNLSSLLVNSNSISLPGYNNGFIGGAATIIDNTLYITGKYNDRDKIIRFINPLGINYVELTDKPVTDLGGIIAVY